MPHDNNSGGDGGAQNDNSGDGDTGQQADSNTDGFTPPATQDELNRIIDDRLKRERAKYADYKDLKGKAARLDELEQANQTEVEKANNRATDAETARDTAIAESLRLRVAAKHGISEDDADLFLTGTDEETLTRQAKRLSEHSETVKKKGNHVPGEGTTPSSNVGDDNERETARALFGGGA